MTKKKNFIALARDFGPRRASRIIQSTLAGPVFKGFKLGCFPIIQNSGNQVSKLTTLGPVL